MNHFFYLDNGECRRLPIILVIPIGRLGRVGDYQFQTNVMALIAEGGVRVDLEDDILLKKQEENSNQQRIAGQDNGHSKNIRLML
jgi:hypothetical protein